MDDDVRLSRQFFFFPEASVLTFKAWQDWISVHLETGVVAFKQFLRQCSRVVSAAYSEDEKLSENPCG